MKKRQKNAPIDAVIFDCDGTLSSVEGIIELAKQNGVLQAVSELTELAMATVGVNESLYRQRLALVQPTHDQITDLATIYWRNLTPDVAEVITILQNLGKKVVVVSAGITQSVVLFAKKLNIQPQDVYAVAVDFDADGRYKDFDTQSPLVRQRGKAEIALALKQQYPRIAHIGDGMNDADAAQEVDLFIGYGGVYFRQSIADLSDAYVTSKSMAAVLPLILTAEEAASLPAEHLALYEQGL